MAFLRKYKLTINFPKILFNEGILAGVSFATQTLLGPQDAIILEDHHISFTTDKSNKKALNGIKLKIFNMPKQYRQRLSTGAQITLEVGYADEDFKIGSAGTLAPIFLGFIKNFSTDTTKADIVTSIEGKDGWVNVKEGYSYRSFPEGTTTRQAIEEIATKDLFLEDVVFESEGLDILDVKRDTGITVMGASYPALIDMCLALNLQCSIRDGRLIVDNISGASKVSVFNITSSSGLIGQPTRLNPADNKRLGVSEGDLGFKLKTLLNPAIQPNSVIALDTDEFIGDLKVISIKHTGDFEGTSWFSDIITKVISGVTKDGNQVTR